MKTQGEIEAAVCRSIARFEQDYMGRGPKDIHAFLIGDLVVVRLIGVLTVAEQQLVAALSAEKGRDLLKQVRVHLVETARPVMEQMIQENHRRRSGQPTSRYQHAHRRRNCGVHACCASYLSRVEEVDHLMNDSCLLR